MRFDEQANPRPEPPSPRGRIAVQWLIWPVAVALIVLGVFLIQESRTDQAPTGGHQLPSQPSLAPSPIVMPTFPPVILEMAAAIATEYAPTSTPTPTPVKTYTPLPTPMLPYCMASLPDGTLCEWKPAPIPTPTPEPPCLTPQPTLTCLWHGGIATPAASSFE